MEREITRSEFYKWRCLVAFAHVDRVFVPEERNAIDMRLRGVPFSEEQRETIRDDMAHPKNVMDLYAQVDNPKDRKDLVQLAYTIFWSDGEFADAEKKIYEYIKSRG